MKNSMAGFLGESVDEFLEVPLEEFLMETVGFNADFLKVIPREYL